MIVIDFQNFEKFIKIYSLERYKSIRILQISKKALLQNDYLVAKIGVDTAENEPSKVVSRLGAAGGLGCGATETRGGCSVRRSRGVARAGGLRFQRRE